MGKASPLLYWKPVVQAKSKQQMKCELQLTAMWYYSHFTCINSFTFQNINNPTIHITGENSEEDKLFSMSHGYVEAVVKVNTITTKV